MNRSLCIHIGGILLCATVALMSLSCSKSGTETYVGDEEEQVNFVLTISAEGASAQQTAADMVETVKSLRVIIMDGNGRLEINERVSLDKPQYAAKEFVHVFIRSLKVGSKRVFLLANEQSTGQISVTDRTGLPDDVELTTLTALLDLYDPEQSNGPEYTGTNLANILNRVYFKNDYSQMTDGSTIALPYSAYYEVNTRRQSETTMYLVPVAAKFDFVFINYRKYDAHIDEIVISSLNSHNYLNAKLDQSEKQRTLPDGTQNVWWIDWLEACARGSQTAADNAAFNETWGWISKYELPVKDEPTRALSLIDDNDEWVVERLVDISNPSQITVGPFYVPESINLAESEEGGEAEQSYSLTFRVHDGAGAAAGEVVTLEDQPIDALRALFRATHTIVYVRFYESKAEIYAEIYPWVERSFRGYVQQDEDYS